MSVVSKNYTIETRLELKNNEELVSYFENYIRDYNLILRYVWRQLTSPTYKEEYPKKSYFVTHLCTKYTILKRTANSIMYEVEGRVKSLKALKEYEKRQLEYKIGSLENKRNKLSYAINNIKPKVRVNKATEKQLKKYRENKRYLYYINQKLNKKKMKLKQLSYELENNILKICFGTKKLYDSQYRLNDNGFRSHKGWYNTFVKNRDKNIYYMGSKDETKGNQLFQITYNETTDDFYIKLRKENKYTEDSKYIEGICNFKYQRKYLKNMLIEGIYPLTYRVKRVGTKWYLQVVITIRNEVNTCLTRSTNGVLGLDYNKGFIELCEINKEGNIVNLKHIKMYHKGCNIKAINEIRQVVSQVCNYALGVGKDIVIEDLNFKKTKAKILKGKGKQGKTYNKMVNQLDYSRYKETFENSCFRNKVGLKMVNPYNTSKIGIEKYAYEKKLSSHQSASYVIARKGQGFLDKLK